MSRTEREQTVSELTDQIRASSSLFVTDFSGLNVMKMTDFRRKLREAGARYVVVKNTLAKRALAANDIAELDQQLVGTTGFVLVGDDPMAAAKVLGEFAREHEKPTIRVGWIDGKAVEPAYVKRLGSIPPREVLLGQFVGGLNGILYQMVGALEALREQRSASEAA